MRDRHISISANLMFEGGTDSQQRAVEKGIMDNWDRKIGGYEVSVDLHDGAAPTVDVRITQTSGDEYSGQSGSKGPGQGGEMNLAVGNDMSAVRRLGAHEFGHVLGIKDSHGNYDLMRSRNPGVWLGKEQITEMMASCVRLGEGQ